MVDLDPVKRSFLDFLGVYRVATRGTLATLLDSGGEPDKHLAALVKHGLVRAQRNLPGNRSVYHLTAGGAAAADVSPARGRRLGTQSLLKNLGVLLFCHQEWRPHHRVEAAALAEALGGELPEGAYCVGPVKENVCILDCYVPGPHTPSATIARRLAKRLRALKASPAAAQAIRDRRLGLCVIVHTRPRRKAVMDAVRTAQDGALPLIRRVRVWVEAVEELGALLGTAAPDLGGVAGGAAQTALLPLEPSVINAAREARSAAQRPRRAAGQASFKE